jgi:hypothetical protein
MPRLALALVLAAAVLAAAPSPAADPLDGALRDLELIPLAGRTPPAFALATLDGRTMGLAEARGRPVLVYFWATW